MNKKTFVDYVERVETTIGDLVEAITQIALETGKTEEEGYQLAALTIEKVITQKQQRLAEIIQ